MYLFLLIQQAIYKSSTKYFKKSSKVLFTFFTRMIKTTIKTNLKHKVRKSTTLNCNMNSLKVSHTKRCGNTLCGHLRNVGNILAIASSMFWKTSHRQSLTCPLNNKFNGLVSQRGGFIFIILTNVKSQVQVSIEHSL